MAVLDVRGLTTEFDSSRLGKIRTLDNLSFTLEEGEILGVVGETAAGKTVLLRSVLGLLHEGERILDGEVVFRGEKLPITDDKAMLAFRGSRISLIQSGQRARLDPVRRIGDQLVDVMKAHRKFEKKERPVRALELIRSVGIPAAEVQLRAYPHELSGGMCQRVVIALALANSPELLMADEPTAGLDVTIQVQILDLFRSLVEETGAASILATRDLAQVAHYCNQVLILRGGQAVEESPVRTFFAAPTQDYSVYLLRMAAAARGEEAQAGAIPTGRTAARTDSETLLAVRDLVKHFATTKHTVHAVNGVSFDIAAGRTLALVGESGSGKTTIGRCIAGLIHPTSGSMQLIGKDIAHISTRRRSKQPELETQVVFQEPRESLNPRWSLGQSIEEPLRHEGKLDRQQRARRVLELLKQVGLPPDHAELYPHQTTAGVQQRVATARAISVQPKLVVLDEPTSALDLSVKVQMIDLLIRLQEELGVSYLFISHDMTAVKMIAHDIAIMYLGRILEVGPADAVFERQFNPYGRALLSSVLYPDPGHERSTFRLEGEIPSPVNMPPGCPLASRCPLVQPRCTEAVPTLDPVGGRRASACLRTGEIVAAGGPEALRSRERETARLPD